MQHSKTSRALPLSLLLILLLPGLVRAASDVRAEAWISDATPYVQQGVVYTVRVYSRGNTTIVPQPLTIAGASLEKIDGPINRKIDPWTYQSDFRYVLLPLKAGRIRVPPMEVKIEPGSGAANWRSVDYSIYASEVNLDVRPAAVTGQTWLPLYGLELRAEVEQGAEARVGEPLVLEVTQQAWGAGGERLPNIAPLLEAPEFKVYSEQPEFMQQVDDSGRYLQGIRKQTFTLVPTRDGELAIPPLATQWWDLRSNRMNTAEWPGAMVSVAAGIPGSEESTESAGEVINSRSWTIVLLGLVALVSFGLGWWISAGRPSPRRLFGGEDDGEQAAVARPANDGAQRVGGLGSRVGGWVDRLQARVGETVEFLLLVRLRRTLKGRLKRIQPRRLALWRLRRKMEKTQDPKKLESLIQRYAALQLGLAEKSTLPQIGDAIEQHYPKLSGTTARQLLQRLDAGLYGNSPNDASLQGCNKDICCLLRSLGLNCPPKNNTRRRAELPALNPRPSS